MLRQANEIDSVLISQMSLARRRTDELFERVPAQLLYERPIEHRHRIVFYIGHLEAFDANLLGLAGASEAECEMRRLFAFGIDSVGGKLPSDVAQDWPQLAIIRQFVARTRARMDRWLMDKPPTLIDGVTLTTLLHAAVEHRWMHAETLAYMLNRLPSDKALRRAPARSRDFSDDDMVTVPAGSITLGRSGSDEGFGWDNEYGVHAVDLPAFQIDRYMVTNGQFLRFVDAGGYLDRRWWKVEDWQWRDGAHIHHPAAWREHNHTWEIVSLTQVVEFQPDWPVYVSHAEASAYACWAGKQLPTEAQWQRAAYGTATGAEREYPWGDAAPDRQYGNFDFRQWDPSPVDAHPVGSSAFGVTGLLGNGWEWTCTPFAGFSGFEPLSFYRGYSADFFDGQHWVQKGGSAHTAMPLLRRSFRNWFQPHYPYAFAGFRCVRQI